MTRILYVPNATYLTFAKDTGLGNTPRLTTVYELSLIAKAFPDPMKFLVYLISSITKEENFKARNDLPTSRKCFLEEFEVVRNESN